MRIRASLSIAALLVLTMAGSARAQGDRQGARQLRRRADLHFWRPRRALLDGMGTGGRRDIRRESSHRDSVRVRVPVVPGEGRDRHQAGRFSANHQTHQLAFNMIANLTNPDSAVSFYVTAGPGMYNRKVEITEYEGNGIICDPWYYVCGTYPIESSSVRAAAGTSASTWAPASACRSARDCSSTSRRATTRSGDRKSFHQRAFRRYDDHRRRTVSTFR